MANNTSCGCMGALRCVAGPFNNCCSSFSNDCYSNFPFYGGPCPSCSGCSSGSCRRCSSCNNNCGCGNWNGCSSCNNNCGWNNWNSCGCGNNWNNWNNCGGWCGCGSGLTRSSAGMFVANAPLSVSSGDIIPLCPKRHNPNCFECCNGCIRIARSGLYHVVWTVNVPSHQHVSGKLFVTLNGVEVEGSGQSVCCQDDSTCTSVTGQALVQSGSNGILCLNTDCDIDIPASCCVENLITLTITRVN